MPKVYAPNEKFNGVRAGVAFSKGVGEMDADDKLAKAFFERHGYGIGKKPDEQLTPRERAAQAHAEATTAPHHPAASRLRDAAVKPEERDFLPPTNAGKEDPHGPLVVAPEIHHDGPAGLRPGDVHVDDPDRQSAEETALAEKILVDGQDKTDAVREVVGEPTEMPAKSASQKAWAAWAVSQGADVAEAEAATRKELIERYGGEG